MPSKIVCFWIGPTDQMEVSFRRSCWVGSPPLCGLSRVPYPGGWPVEFGYHNEEVALERRPRSMNDSDDSGRPPTDIEKQDPRWPKKCSCGYVFVDTDFWQRNIETLFKRVGTDEIYTLADAPAGAMYDAHWYRSPGDPKKADGKNLVLKTPAGDWHIDGPASNGPGWARTGEPPNITCNPSIGIGSPQRLHGWLRNGVLEIDSP